MVRRPPPTARTAQLACLAATLALAACGSPAKPADADIATYLARSSPAYLQVGAVSFTAEPAGDLGGSKLPAGSWRLKVQFTLHARQDLYAPTPESIALRRDFDHQVSATEGFRVARIEAVERLARQAGLMPEGALAPEPAMAVAVATHKDQDLADHVTLLAQPDGKGWKFFQLDAQALSEDAIGAPMEALHQTSPKTAFVLAGSDQDRQFQSREKQFLEVLAKAGKP
jgi:hypothetical protein